MTSEPNIVLAGFMGTGKTATGRVVASRLERPLVDMDSVLVQRMGAPIAEIFARQGEAYFRQAESALCQELSKPKGLVIAAGGGAVVSMANRLALGRGGVVFCLSCSPEACLRRIKNIASRPMLKGGDPASRVAQLMAERQPAYEAIPRQIDTTHLSVEQVAEQVIRLYQRDVQGENLTVHHRDGTYNIVQREGILASVGSILADLHFAGTRAALVTNTVVAPLYAQTVVAGLERDAAIHPVIMEMADGEVAKNLATVEHLYDQMAAAGLERGEPVIALGGGVVGDVAGFLAATYLRGVPLIQVPTTVLAMVDSSVGGKVAVDHARGKNLIGAFKQPEVVIADPAVLLSLPDVERRSGLAEIVKHGLINAPDIIAHLERESVPDLAWLIPQAVRVKIPIVEEDPFEQHGRRMILNLGHTFGHALENLSGYRLRHGEGVSIGMVAAARLAARLGICTWEMAGRVERLLARLGLPVRYHGFTPEEVWAAMANDKKSKGRRLRFVLPVAPGETMITDDVPREMVIETLKEIGE